MFKCTNCNYLFSVDSAAKHFVCPQCFQKYNDKIPDSNKLKTTLPKTPNFSKKSINSKSPINKHTTPETLSNIHNTPIKQLNPTATETKPSNTVENAIITSIPQAKTTKTEQQNPSTTETDNTSKDTTITDTPQQQIVTTKNDTNTQKTSAIKPSSTPLLQAIPSTEKTSSTHTKQDASQNNNDTEQIPPDINDLTKLQVFVSKIASFQTTPSSLPKPLTKQQKQEHFSSSIYKEENIVPKLLEDSKSSKLSQTQENELPDDPFEKLLEFSQNESKATFFNKEPIPYHEFDTDNINTFEKLFNNTIQHNKLNIISICAPNGYGKSRFIHTQLLKHKPHNFKIYSPVQTFNLSFPNLIESMIYNRIGATLEDKRPKIKAQIEFFLKTNNLENKLWASELLHSLYNLPLPKNIQKTSLLSSNKKYLQCALLDFFKKILLSDLKDSPVVIIIDNLRVHSYIGFYEFIDFLRENPNNPLFIILADTPENLKPLENLKLPKHKPITLQPLSSQNIETFIKQLFKLDDFKLYNTITSSPAEIINFSQYLLQNNIITATQLNSEDQSERKNILTTEFANLNNASSKIFNSLTDDHEILLRTASVLDKFFSLEELSTILSIYPLEGDIPWFHNLRLDWTQKTAFELVNKNILKISDKLFSFKFAYFKDFIASQNSPAQAKTIHGLCAKNREKNDPQSISIAMHLEKTYRFEDATNKWIEIAQRLADSFYNQSAIKILEHCTTYMGPQNALTFIKLTNELIALYQNQANFYEAEQLCISNLRSAAFIQNRKNSAEAFINLAKILKHKGDYSDAQTQCLFAIELAQTLNDHDLIADAHLELAQITMYIAAKASLVEALRFAEKSLEIQRQYNNLPKIADCLDVLAQICIERGEFDRADNALTEALNAKNASGLWFKTPKTLIKKAKIAIIKATNETEALLQAATQITNYTNNIIDKFEIGETYLELALKTNNNIYADKHVKEMENLSTLTNYKPWEAKLLKYKITLLLNNTDYKTATKELQKFVDLTSKLKSFCIVAEALQLSALLNYTVLKQQIATINTENTKQSFKNAIALFESMGAWQKVTATLNNYAAFLVLIGENQEAQIHRQRAAKLDPLQIYNHY